MLSTTKQRLFARSWSCCFNTLTGMKAVLGEAKYRMEMYIHTFTQRYYAHRYEGGTG
jgi:hypothetical protein